MWLRSGRSTYKTRLLAGPIAKYLFSKNIWFFQFEIKPWERRNSLSFTTQFLYILKIFQEMGKFHVVPSGFLNFTELSPVSYYKLTEAENF